MEPSNAVVEAGCQGTLRVEVTHQRRARPLRAHLEGRQRHPPGRRRSSSGSRRTSARKPVIDGLEYHEGLNAVFIRGGVAGNVLPDECVVEVNYRFAPDRSEAEAEAFVRDFFDGYDVDGHRQRARRAAGPRPCPRPRRSSRRSAATVNPKFGWTDVARFTALGVPAVNFGPGDPMLAHKQEEYVPRRADRALRAAAARLARRDGR